MKFIPYMVFYPFYRTGIRFESKPIRYFITLFILERLLSDIYLTGINYLGVIVSRLIFGDGHVIAGFTLRAFITYTVMGLLLGFFYVKTGRLENFHNCLWDKLSYYIYKFGIVKGNYHDRINSSRIINRNNYVSKRFAEETKTMDWTFSNTISNGINRTYYSVESRVCVCFSF